MQSKSAVSTGDGKFVIENVTRSDPQPDEVNVKMKAAGLCYGNRINSEKFAKFVSKQNEKPFLFCLPFYSFLLLKF